jgi:carbon starvation protein
MEKEDRSLWIILAGIVVFSLWYTVTKRTENALWLVLAAVCFLLLAYRLYGGLTATRAAMLAADVGGPDVRSATPAWVAFGYQFGAIAGAGVLVGPVLAAQYGYLPGYLWALLAAVLAGAVHDLVVLVASMRRKGAFLPSLITEHLGPWAGLAAWGIVILGLLAFLAVSGSYAANLLVGNVWALYTVTVTVVVAVLVSAYEAWLRPGRAGEAITIGIIVAGAAIVIGSRLAMQTATEGLLASRGFVLVLLGVYCFVSAILPMRVLGRARGAISGYLALAGVIFLAAAIAFSAPALRQTATTQYASGNGPLLPGGAVPYLAIIMMMGVISGFNGLATTGVTSRLVDREADALPVGYGALLVQSLLVVLVLVGVSTLHRWDFYAMTSPAHLNEIERIAGSGQRDWDNLRNILKTDSLSVPGGQTAAGQVDNVRVTSGATALSAATAWMMREFPGVQREALPTIYRFMFVLQALILLAGVEAAARAVRVAVEEVGKVALHTPPLERAAGAPAALTMFVAAGTLALTIVWILLAAKANVLGTFNLLAVLGFALATLGLGAGFLALRQKGRWWAALVAAPLVAVIVLSVVVGLVTIRDSVRYLGRSNALAQAYAELPNWVGQYKFVNMDRAREIGRQWPPAEMTKLYAEKGQAEVARVLRERLGLSEADGKTLTTALSSRATSLSLWSWLQIVLTLLLYVLLIGVAVGKFIQAPLRWPQRVRATPALTATPAPTAATAPVAPAKPPDEPKKEETEFEL